MDPPAIALEKVSKRFGDRWVLQDVSLNVALNEFVVLLGASGCGKSTLLRVIAGLDSLDSGNVRMHGVLANRTPPHKRGCSMAFQSGLCYDRWTVERNLRHASGTKDDGWLESMLKQLELQHCRLQKPTSLSGGERQRLALARAMISSNPIMLLDEPLAQLHPNMRIVVREWIREVHQKRNKTTIYVTHDLSEAMWLADRVVLMDSGQIVAAGNPRELFSPAKGRVAADFLGYSLSQSTKDPTMNDGTQDRFTSSTSLEIIALEEWGLEESSATNQIPVVRAWQGTLSQCRWIGHGWELKIQPIAAPGNATSSMRIYIADTVSLSSALRTKLQVLEKTPELNSPIRFVERQIP